jgi:transposase, IS5 family
MIRYTSATQLSIEEFQTPFQLNLDKDNRWVKLAAIIPWDELAGIYYQSMSADMGAPSIDARIVIGAMIVKHKLKLDDREVVETIKENMYLQYFLGLSAYTAEPLFDRSLFTAFRYRLGKDKFDRMSQLIIAKALDNISPVQDKDKGEDKPPGDAGAIDKGADEQRRADSACAGPNSGKPKGKLKIDATVADQMIKYPTDLDLLSDSREQSERLIDQLCELLKLSKKQRTYRRNARRDYLNMAKKKKKNKRELHKAIGKQLNYLKRNLGTIDKLLDSCPQLYFSKRDYKISLVIRHIYAQQLQMHKDKTHSHADRIVNIYQPHVRAIVRGKAKAMVEFGAKLGVSEQNGYVRINTLSWDAYNEGSDLVKQAEAYRELNGHYPEVVITDTIYGTRENRAWLKDKGIRYSGKALGRPPKTPQTPYQKRKFKIEQSERNHIEGKFGQGKNGYNLNKIRARKALTSESWIACILFVMNLVKFFKDFSLAIWQALISFANDYLYCGNRKINIREAPLKVDSNIQYQIVLLSN